MTLQFYQIYFHDDQIKELYPFAAPYKNETLTPYFENSVIAELVPKCTADLVGVCSWALKRKRNDGLAPIINANGELTEERIFSREFDVAILTPKSSQHHIMAMAYNWHGDAWVKAIQELKKFIRIPEEMIGNAIYENHFIAKREIYQEYVNTCLVPAISFMADKEVFKTASGYRRKKERIAPREEVQKVIDRLSEFYGDKLIDYPIAPFVLERLFRIWINNKKLNIVNL